MNRSFYSRALSLLLACLMLFVSGCHSVPGQSGDTTEAETEAPTPTAFSLMQDRKLLFSLIRGEYATDREKRAAMFLRDSLIPFLDSYPQLTDDWDYKDDNAGRLEVLIGMTNRPESAAVKETLGKNSYAIRHINGKLVIIGSTSEMTYRGVQAFISAYLTEENPTCMLPYGIDYVGQSESYYIDLEDPTAQYYPHTLVIATNRFGLDKAYIVKNTAAANDFIRFCDCNAELIYHFSLADLVQPNFVLTMNQEYRIEVSGEEKGPWKEIETKSAGTILQKIAIDPFALNITDALYIRLTDPTTKDGGGAAIHSIKFSYYTKSPLNEHPYYLDEDMKKVVSELRNMNEKIEVDGFAIHADGGMIYDPISREKAAQLYKYNGADVFEGTLTLGGKTLSYSIPKNVTAYDAVPLHYTLTTTEKISSSNPFHISVTGYEDKERTGDEAWYDLNLPGTVDIAFEYDGYVTGKTSASVPKLSQTLKTKDVIAKVYPQYTVSDLVRSGTLPEAEITWFKFTYTNTGDTILDYDGNGTFAFEPRLYKKVGGEWKDYSGTQNLYYVLENELYPGESQSFWINFITPPTAGEYRIVINGLIRNEISDPANYARTIFHGNVITTSSMEFAVKEGKAAVTEPQPIKESNSASSRNRWMHYYEEYQSSYVSMLKADVGTISDTVYVQLSPWTNQVMLKIMEGNKQNMVAVSIPISVESDSIKVELDPNNPNYVLLEDGTRFPAIMTHSMADMRINDSQSPYMAHEIVSYLAEMKDLGINVINTTAAFMYAEGKGGTAFQFSMDVARELGLEVEGPIIYPYSNSKLGAAYSYDPTFNPSNTGDLDAQDIAAGIMAKNHFIRWGDNFWMPASKVVMSIEDTRGGFGITTNPNNVRHSPDVIDMQNFVVFLQSLYGSIDELNEAWGTSYTSFYQIKVGDKNGVTLNAFTPATNDYDAFLSYHRALNYKTLLAEASDVIPNLKLDLRLEGSNWICKIDPSSTNQNYRFVLANQNQNALIPSILAQSETLYCFSDYFWENFSPSEVAYMSKSSYEDYGIVSAQIPLINRLRDVALNSKYGSDFSSHFNIKGKNVKAVQINTTASLFEWWKATYENHGIPAVMWSDFTCDGIATATVRREIEFFVSKLKQTMSTPEGIKWCTEFEHDDSVLKNTKGLYSYDKSFVRDAIADYYASKEND